MGAISVYVHIPFCVRKCPYCAFESAQIPNGGEEILLDGLERELASRASDGAILARTMYIGGGTPTALGARYWPRLFDILDRHVSRAECEELTVEANPHSLTRDHLTIWRERGATRVSVGVQSFDDAELSFLGRLHDSRRAADAVAACSAAGFDVSIDLMFGIPGSDLRTWWTSMRRAISLAPSHISVYQLTIEPGTPFASRGFVMPDGYPEYRASQWLLPHMGYRQYEIANFARPGRESRHNTAYWTGGEYAGVGPGAWSWDGETRSKNVSGLEAWAERPGEADEMETLTGERAAREAAILALRTADGIDLARLAARYGHESAAKILRELKQFAPELAEVSEARARLSPKGMRMANAIWSEIV